MAEEKLRTRPPTVFEDPNARAIARVYADAFLKAAEGAGVEQGLEEFASFLSDVLDRNPEFRSIFVSTMVNRDDKLGMIDRAIAPHASPIFANFLRVLARHERLDLLPLIFEQSRAEFERRSGRRRVEVVSAKPLSEANQEKIRQRLRDSLRFEPILETRVDPRLLGGLVLRVGDTVYDSSLRTRLKQLHARMRQRSTYEIQSGRDRFSSPA